MASECEWGGIDSGPIMPEPPIEETRRIAYLVGVTDVNPGDAIARLIREAYRHGWEAAESSHSEWRNP